MGYATTNPYTGEVVKTFPDATDAEVDAALDKGHAAFLSWRATSFSERAAVLSKAAGLARERREELARLNTLEMGKLFTESLWEVEIIAQMLEYYAANGERLLAPERLEPGDPVGSATPSLSTSRSARLCRRTLECPFFPGCPTAGRPSSWPATS
jgi:succinate-semialdehyde dehydrogenase / glutarate-semialdehyde dehydrogenase